MMTHRNFKMLTFSIALLGMISGTATAGILSSVSGAVGGAVGGVTSGVSSAVGGATSGAGSMGGGNSGNSSSGASSSGLGSSVSGLSSGLGSTVGGLTSSLQSNVGSVTSPLGAALGGVTNPATRSLASVRASLFSSSGVALARADILHAVDARLNVMSDQQLLRLCVAVGGGGCGGMNRVVMTRFIRAYAGMLNHRNLLAVCVSVGSCSAAPVPKNPTPVVQKRIAVLHKLPARDEIVAASDIVSDTSDNADYRFVAACQSMAFYGVSVGACRGVH